MAASAVSSRSKEGGLLAQVGHVAKRIGHIRTVGERYRLCSMGDCILFQRNADCSFRGEEQLANSPGTLPLCSGEMHYLAGSDGCSGNNGLEWTVDLLKHRCDCCSCFDASFPSLCVLQLLIWALGTRRWSRKCSYRSHKSVDACFVRSSASIGSVWLLGSNEDRTERAFPLPMHSLGMRR